jgi:hypothetical protein
MLLDAEAASDVNVKLCYPQGFCDLPFKSHLALNDAQRDRGIRQELLSMVEAAFIKPLNHAVGCVSFPAPEPR